MSIELGCGLIGIGREWGYKTSRVPSEDSVGEFLKTALALQIRFFDTAPSYGMSEQRLGHFLQTLSLDQRKEITIATKCGEHWDEKTQSPYVDHSFESLCKSIDESVKKLQKVDLLQIHKTTPKILEDSNLSRVLDYARTKGITQFGASVSDEETGVLVCEDPRFSALQLPYNQGNTSLGKVLARAKEVNKLVLINRPFNMGEIFYQDSNSTASILKEEAAFKFILRQKFRGVILTGTKSSLHLKENFQAFKNVIQNLSD